MSAPRSDRFTPGKEPSLSIGYDAGWALEPI